MSHAALQQQLLGQCVQTPVSVQHPPQAGALIGWALTVMSSLHAIRALRHIGGNTAQLNDLVERHGAQREQKVEWACEPCQSYRKLFQHWQFWHFYGRLGAKQRPVEVGILAFSWLNLFLKHGAKKVIMASAVFFFLFLLVFFFVLDADINAFTR